MVPALSTIITKAYSSFHPQFSDANEKQIMESPLMTKLAQARIAYLRLMINVHRHRRASGTDGAPASFWDLIDEDLEARNRKNKIYNVAFAQLVYEKDIQLWNGKRSLANVATEDQGLPDEEKILERVTACLENNRDTT